MVEGRRWAEEVLALEDEIPPLVRARAYLVVGFAAVEQGDDDAVALLTEARALARAAGERWIEGHSLLVEGFLAPVWDNVAGGIELMWQGQRILREAGDEWGVGLSLTGLSSLFVLTG